MSDTIKKTVDAQVATKKQSCNSDATDSQLTANSPSYPSVTTKFPLDSMPNKIIIRGNFYTTNEVAKTIGITRHAVEKWRAKGRFLLQH